MDLKIIEKSRKKIRKGDLFLVCPSEQKYFLGRVVEIENIKHGGFEGILVYLYDEYIDNIHPEDLNNKNFSKDNLLIPPMIVSSSMWRFGFFYTIGNLEVESKDKFEKHCFKDNWKDGLYFDEYNNQCHYFEPCGEYSILGSTDIFLAIQAAK